MINNIINSDFEIDVEFAIKQKWEVRMIPESLSMMETEWLAETIIKSKVKELFLYYFEFGQSPSKISLDNINIDILLGLFSEHTYHYLVLTSDDFQFLYYKDQGNKYSLIFGNNEFVKSAYKTTYKTHEIIFLDYVKDDINNEEEQSFLLNIWEKYDYINKVR